jgi:hypothetical protein
MGKRFNGWLRPWAASAITGMLVFATVHQVLVAWAPAVYIGVPVALVLSIPIVAAYAALARDGDKPSGTLFGLVVFAGFVPHYVLITIAMWDRTFDDGPRGGWLSLALISAPLLSGGLAWFVWRSLRGTILLMAGMLVLTSGISGFQESEPDRANLGALVALLPACLAAGWVLARVRERSRTESSASIA